jgi:hypothetical protein
MGDISAEALEEYQNVSEEIFAAYSQPGGDVIAVNTALTAIATLTLAIDNRSARPSLDRGL